MRSIIPRRRSPVSLVSVEDPVLALDNVRLRAENEQLHRAMASRPVIDQARGMVMALAPCSSERAWQLLVDVSQHCNVKLRDVAAALVATTEGQELTAQLRSELRSELRQARAEQQLMARRADTQTGPC